jgi:hypothetical protein
VTDTFKSPGSRYDGLPIAEHHAGDGPPQLYITRRFIAPPDERAVLTEHRVEAGDRLDRIAADQLGDSEQSWRLCDANAVLSPAELLARVGQRIRIALPDGLPGAPDAR